MASRVALSWEGNDVLKGMATQLAVMLSAGGKKERKAWSQLHGKVAEVAASIADPKMSVQALVSNLQQEMGSLDLGYPDAQVLLRQIVGLVEEKISAENAAASKAISVLKNMILLVADQLNMIPLRNSIHLEMIDGDTNFSERNVDGMVKCSVELSAPNAPYSVVSIVGAQSSGKSYLLNHLFGTKFPVMESRRKRSQTTKGILISRCIQPSLLVLDIEGFDGRERGQDKVFEKKAALFALTVSDLMMVNISIFNIGLEEGSGMALFRTIFQERTKLDPGLTKIIVVVRNCDEETMQSLEILRQDVMETLEEVWISVNKESTFRDYIEIHVAGLPEKDTKDFQKEVTNLRKLLSSSSTTCAKVPASSFSVSSKMLWNQIMENERLDLPSHMVLLAKLYCQEKAKACVEHFDDKQLKAEESPQGFKEISDALLASIIAQYRQETEMYDAGVRDKECQKMVDNINKIFTDHSRGLIKKIQENTSEQFKVEFAKNLENTEETDDVLVYDDHIVELWTEKFKKLCEDLKVFDPDYFHEICGDLRKQLTSHTILHILSVNEDRARKALESALRRADENVEELTMKLDQRSQERQRREEEIMRENELREEKLKREKELREQEEHKRAKEDLERREKMLEQEKTKMVAEESARRENALQKELETQRERNRALELEMARQIQHKPASVSLFGSVFGR